MNAACIALVALVLPFFALAAANVGTLRFTLTATYGRWSNPGPAALDLCYVRAVPSPSQP